MSFDEFYALVGSCSDGEIDRLKNRYRRYYREHRQVFTDFLKGKYKDEAEFKLAALNARDQASKSGQTSGSASDTGSPLRFSGYGRVNARKFIKLATRILYLRMTGGAGTAPGKKKFEASALPGDHDPLMKPSMAKKSLVKKMKPWGIGYDAIRKYHTPFQLDP